MTRILTKTLVDDTLKLMHLMERMTEDGDCYLWTGSTNAAGHPKLHDQPTRRVIWRLVHGEIPEGKMITTTCSQSTCLCPEHLALTTKSEISRKVAQRHDFILRKSAANAKSARDKLGKITMEMAREIRESERTGRDLARELGVSTSLISCVRTFKSWKEHSSPWAGLLR